MVAKGRIMTPADFLARLSELSAEDSAGLTELAQDLIREEREIPEAAVKMFKQGNPDTSKKAMITLGEIEEFGIVPLVDSTADLPTVRALWALRTVGANLVHLQRRAVRSIDKALEDRRQAPPPQSTAEMEEQPPPIRVCDEAYLQLRRLLHIEEGDPQYFLNARSFLNLGNTEKDAEIHRARKSRGWSRLVGDRQTSE
jgi:hypothetical protein